MTPPRPQRLARAAAYRMQTFANRVGGASSLRADQLRTRLTGSFGVPARYWPLDRAQRGDFFSDWLPLPITSGLATWFQRRPTEPNDGGDLSANCVLISVERETAPDAFPLAAVPTLFDRRRTLGDRAHTVIVTRDETVAKELRRMLRTLRIGAGVVLVPAPSSTQRQAIFSAISLCLVPDAAPSGTLSAEAKASGRPVISIPTNGPLHRTIDEAIASSQPDARALGRATRLSAMLDAVDRESFEPTVWQPGPSAPAAVVSERPRRVLVASHDLKFAQPAIEAIEAQGHEVRIDRWSGHARHDPSRSASLLAWADTVWCEWTLGNAVWYSKRIGNDQRLVTRLHLQEAATRFPAAVKWDAVDRCIFVAEHVRRKIALDTTLADAKSRVIPNVVTVPDAVPASDPDRRFRLGLVGMVPSRKGLHEALDVLAELRVVDPRFTLSLRGHRPEEYAWMAKRPDERAYFDRAFGRIESEPLLRGAVDFSPFGSDMAAWYSRIGVVLSTSDFESFHYTIPDGAAHGALPRLLAWPGADLLYPIRWLSATPRELAHDILRTANDEHAWSAAAADAREFIRRTYSSDRVVPELVGEVLGTPLPGSASPAGAS